MLYISRRIAVSVANEEKEFSESDFLTLPGPLVILGEPGAGKSEFIKQLEARGAICYSASSVLNFHQPLLLTGSHIIIDALDEVTAYAKGAPISSVLSRIQNEDLSNFIFTCRAADWQHYVNTNAITSRWKKTPVLGKLLPLNDSEIIQFVNANGNGQDGSAFLESASKHNSVELLRNPQTLSMLIQTVEKFGWPKSKTALYEKTCEVLLEESNPMHRSLNQSKTSIQELKEVAGFISAQLILGNKHLISLDGNQTPNVVTIPEISSSSYNEALVKETIATKLFRVVSGGSVEPCHRTVIEYLGGNYISTQLNDRLSQRRLESLLYADDYIVPPALRGLHAWVATTIHKPEAAKEFIERDVYGLFRYGDPAILPIDMSILVLNCLRKLSLDDPLFRNEDWHASFGKGFARPELKDEIISLIRDASVPYQLTYLILDSIKGESFAALIADELVDLVLDTSETQVERNAALDVLQQCVVQQDWRSIVESLIATTNMESLRLALNIIRHEVNLFNGDTIGRALIGISNASRRGPLYAGLGYGLPKIMSLDQLHSALTCIVDYRFQPDNGEPMNDDHKGWLYEILSELFNRKALPEPSILWRVLNRLKRYNSYNRQQFNETSSQYFEENPDARVEVQQQAFAENDSGGLWLKFFLITEACQGLWLRESDIVKHLDTIVKNQKQDWVLKWSDLVWYAIKSSSFTGFAVEHAKKQTLTSPLLSEAFNTLQTPIDNTAILEEKRLNADWEQKRSEEAEKRYASYEQYKEQIVEGKHLHAVNQIARAYLGWFYQFKQDTPEERVAALVGENMALDALRAFQAAIQQGNIPSAKEIIEKRAFENQTFHIEPILIAYCHQYLDKVEIPLPIAASALAACRWGVAYIGDQITPIVQAKLETKVFSTVTSRRDFLCDTIEPYLTSHNEVVAGVSQLSTNDRLADVAGTLSLQWLIKYSNISSYTLNELLKAAIKYSSHDEILKVISQKVQSNNWFNEEQKGVLFGTLFILDFENNVDVLSNFAKEDASRFWSFKTAFTFFRNTVQLNVSQNFFILLHFANAFSDEQHPPSGFYGSEHPWEASEFLRQQANELASNLSDKVAPLLNQLISSIDPSTRFHTELRHLYRKHLRLLAESRLQNVSLKDVRAVLLHTSPGSVLDLQAVILDELEMLQRRIKHSQTNDYLTFWNQSVPHDENYCRDRVVSLLTPYLDKFKIRCHTEGTMPNVQRCDFLNTYSNMNLPVEVKGQWHKDMWTAAIGQLENYSKEYRSDGFGIYLVLWFSHVASKSSKNPIKSPNGSILTTLEEFKKQLLNSYEGKISTKTKIFVLDVSRTL